MTPKQKLDRIFKKSLVERILDKNEESGGTLKSQKKYIKRLYTLSRKELEEILSSKAFTFNVLASVGMLKLKLSLNTPPQTQNPTKKK